MTNGSIVGTSILKTDYMNYTIQDVRISYLDGRTGKCAKLRTTIKPNIEPEPFKA